MPSNEFRTPKRKEQEGEGGKKRERDKQGEKKEEKNGWEQELIYRNNSTAWNSFILIPSSSDFLLLFRSQKNGLELVTPIFQSYF